MSAYCMFDSSCRTLASELHIGLLHCTDQLIVRSLATSVFPHGMICVLNLDGFAMPD